MLRIEEVDVRHRSLLDVLVRRVRNHADHTRRRGCKPRGFEHQAGAVLEVAELITSGFSSEKVCGTCDENPAGMFVYDNRR